MTPAAKSGFELIKRGDLPEAAKAFEAAVQSDAKDADAWLGLARVNFASGFADAARKAFERVLELRPNDSEVAAQLALIRSQSGDPKALDDLIALTNAKDAGFYAYFNLGKVLAAKKDWAGAQRAYAKALELEPKSPFPHVELAMIALELKDTAAAVAHFSQAAESDPGDWEPLYYLARARVLRGEVGQAAIDLLKAIERSPHNLRLRADLVKVCLMAGNTRGALVAGEKLFNEFPEDPQALHLYGVAMFTAGQPQLARTAVEEALKRAPGAVEIRQTLAEIDRILKDLKLS